MESYQEEFQEKLANGETINALGVYPKFPRSFWSYEKALRIVGKKAPMAPTGLATVMAMLPERFNPMPIADMNTQKLTPEQIKKSDVVMTSSMIAQQDSHAEVVEMAHYYNKPVISGGPLPTLYPEKMIGVDYIVAGEAEITLKPFLEDLLAGSAKRIYNEENCRDRTETILNKEGKPLLGGTPIPRWDLINPKDYFTYGVQYSRGCPNHCEFCDIPGLNGHLTRTKSPEQMIAEFEAIYKTGFRGDLFIVDDNFIGNKKNAMQFLPELIKWQKKYGHPFTWNTEAGINLAWDSNKELREKMVESGCNHVFVGIESPDPEVIQKMNKGLINLKMDPEKAVGVIYDSGMSVTSGFIIGSDGEKKSIFKNMYDFIQKTGITNPMVGLLTVGKGTPLYDRLDQEGRLKKNSIISGTNTHNYSLDHEPKGEMTEGEIISGYRGLLDRLYLNESSYYDRCKKTLSSIKQRESRRLKLTKDNLATMVRFTKYLAPKWLGGGGGATKESIKYLAYASLKHPKKFTQAATHVVNHRDFKELTEGVPLIKKYTPEEGKLEAAIAEYS